jgi:hypothetical protein
MRTLLVVFCALLVMNLSLEAKRKMPASQKTHVSREHKAMVKKMVKARKAPKHRQRAN